MTQEERLTASPPRSSTERAFEAILWNSRFASLLAVFFGLLSSVTIFVVGSIDIFTTIKKLIFGLEMPATYLVATIIGSIDMFLIGVVLLIFSFGVYELFIAPIRIGRMDKDVHILGVSSLDELKAKIIQVVVMVLVVTFFKQILETEFETPLEMLYFALSILAVSLGVRFMQPSKNSSETTQ